MLEDAIKDVLEHAGVKLLQVSGNVVAAAPDGYKIVDLEQHLPAPKRVREKVRVYRLDDFFAYLTEFATPETVAFVANDFAELAKGTPLVTAILDYHGDESRPSWCDHSVAFHPTVSPAYAILLAMDGKLLPQDEFALRLRDLSRFCTSHTAADLIEIARTITLTSKGEFASLNDDQSGSVAFAYNVQVGARAGTTSKQLEVPREIAFKLPVWLGAKEPSEIRAELLYRQPQQPGQQVQLGVRLPDRLWLEHDLLNQTADQVREQLTGTLVIVGKR